MRGEHGGGAAPFQAVGIGRDSYECVGVYYHGYGCVFDEFGRGSESFRIDTEPGPISRAWKRSRSVRTSEAQLPDGMGLATASVGRLRWAGSTVGEETTVIPAPARSAPWDASWTAPIMPGDPPMILSEFDHLWSVGARWDRGS